MKINAYAKVNINLKIEKKRADGYHELSTLMHSLPLCDKVELSPCTSGIYISCDNSDVPCDERNIAYKTAKAFFESADIDSGVNIIIKKNIPIASGFGGSSTDGAAVLYLLEKHFQKLGRDGMYKLAASLSADMPFMLSAIEKGERGYVPHSEFCRGIGEKMEKAEAVLSGKYVLICKADEGVCSREMYSLFDEKGSGDNAKVTNYNGTSFFNDFEPIAEEKRKGISKALKILNENGADVSMLSGSGSGVFSVFETMDSAEKAKTALFEKGFESKVMLCSEIPEYILFDLDGTLTESAPGIMNSCRYAINKLGLPMLPDSVLIKFVGPPLVESFEKYCCLSKEGAEEMLRIYREYFRQKGMFENRPYDGIPEMLKKLCEKGKRPVLATSKPIEFAEKIIGHFGLSEYFYYCVGATMDGTFKDKADIIGKILSDLNLSPDDAIMVGDRELDDEGAELCKMRSIGVLYGYGDESEHQKSWAVCRTVAELSDILNK